MNLMSRCDDERAVAIVPPPTLVALVVCERASLRS
jgi:hypothetical protein